MHNFTYYAPTEVVFGRDAEAQCAGLVRKYCGSRVFLVYGSGSVVRSGLLDRVTAELADAGLAVETYGGAKANPTLVHARQGVERAIAFGTDFVLALGGGSAIDTAKAIAHGAANPDTDIWQFWSRETALCKSLPIGVILTISAAGSEMSNSAVLTNEDIPRKRGLSTDLNRPKFAIMDPTLTFTLPRYQLSCGVVDIMMHTLDRYFNPLDNALTDELAEALLRVVIAHGPRVLADPTDYEAQSELMWASSLSHNGLTGLGGESDFAVHQLGHELSARFDLAHGASLSAVWGSWAKFVCGTRPERFARYARKVWGIDEADEWEAAQKGIAATVEYFASLDMPVSFGDCIGVQSEETVAQMAHGCSYDGTRTIGSFRVLSEPEIGRIYAMANH